MLNLTFPKYEFRLKGVNQKKFIFDEIRKIYSAYTRGMGKTKLY